MLVVDLSAGDALPIERLVRYVHPRLAAMVRLSRPELGAAADVALAFDVVGVLLVATVHGRRIIAGTPDLVAGQLLALAFRVLMGPADEERLGPWENATVQRATELGLGVIHPGQFDLACESGRSNPLVGLGHDLRLLLGIP